MDTEIKNVLALNGIALNGLGQVAQIKFSDGSILTTAGATTSPQRTSTMVSTPLVSVQQQLGVCNQLEVPITCVYLLAQVVLQDGRA